MSARRRLAPASLWLACALAAGCATTGTRPAALTQLDRVVGSPVAREAQRDAPEAYAEFARAAHVAEAAQGGPPAVLDERVAEAELTLAWAGTQARGARARARAQDADRRRSEAELDSARMEQQAVALDHESDAVLAARQAAQRAHLAAGAVPPAERATTAAEVRQQAELTLAAAVLLGADATERGHVEELVRAAETAVHGNDATAALVAAGRALTAAQALVQHARTATPATASGTEGGALVAQLSEAGGLEPRRDERGVIATLRGLFSGTALLPTARGRLEEMARVIQGHADAHVRVEAYVGGADHARAERTATAQAQAVTAALVRAGVPAARLQAAGLYRIPDGSRSQDVVEIVLVLPREP